MDMQTTKYSYVLAQ